MKKNLLLLAMLTLAVSPAIAAIDTKTTTEPYFLRNSNYSEEAIRLIQLDKHYANGIPLPAKTETRSKSRQVVDAVFNYVDPAWDDKKFFVRDLPQQPGFDDL